jgi:hypothetical protein
MKTTETKDMFDTWRGADDDFEGTRTPGVKVLVALNVASMIVLAWQWFQLKQILSEISPYEYSTLSSSIRTTANVYLWGIPVVIIITGVLAIGLWNLKNWARVITRGLYMLTLGSAVLSLFSGGLSVLWAIQVAIAVFAVIQLNQDDVKYVFNA